jgi:hypothetical protein
MSTEREPAGGDALTEGERFRRWLVQGPRALDDCRTRLWWMNSDGAALDADASSFITAGVYSIHVDLGGERGRAFFHRNVEQGDEEDWYAAFAKRLGAYLDNGRAALNYLTYQLALLAISEDASLEGTLHPEAVEFPIFNDPGLFRTRNRVKSLPERYRTMLRDEQPFNGRNHGLWILHELSREFRHRVIHAVAVVPRSDSHSIVADGEPITDVRPVAFHGSLAHGDEILSFSLQGLAADAHIEARVATSVGIDHPLCAERDVIAVLNEINTDLVELMERFEPLFT